ncbi:hypothetical protein V5799_025224 [Amblyomma americanum]|uniref:Uncharacterized protein n=1 Tax=Amblyomma americanum TaxID=6943 RepID=A0AAQ4EAC3_AMBAM
MCNVPERKFTITLGWSFSPLFCSLARTNTGGCYQDALCRVPRWPALLSGWYPAFAEIMGMETAPLKQCGTGRLKGGNGDLHLSVASGRWPAFLARWAGGNWGTDELGCEICHVPLFRRH